MIAWSRMKTLAVGCALIVAANAVALIGVAHNRSGEAESRLRLSQRELRLPYGWRAANENSGISLTLQWQVPQPTSGEARYGSPAWLDEAKLAALGFDLPTQPKANTLKQKTKEVLLVLELDGSARQQALVRLRQHLFAEETLLAANPGKKEFESRVQRARHSLANEEDRNSRLYLIDAGLDRDALRALYPDRERYAIVRGKVRPALARRGSEEYLIGTISGLMASQINVPRAFHQALGPQPQDRKQAESRTYSFEIAFGKKLEPWIVAATSPPQ